MTFYIFFSFGLGWISTFIYKKNAEKKWYKFHHRWILQYKIANKLDFNLNLAVQGFYFFKKEKLYDNAMEVVSLMILVFALYL